MAAKRGRTWEKDETLELIKKWGDENTQELLRTCNRKKPIWNEISIHLKAMGFVDREADACKTRIHTLVTSYRRYKDACAKSGNAKPSTKAPFYEEIDCILGDRPCTRPLTLINSLQIAETSKQDEDEGEDGDESFGEELQRLEKECLDACEQDNPEEILVKG